MNKVISKLNKISFSFVAMLVINPIILLFYQNCTVSPLSNAKSKEPLAAFSVQRGIANQGKVKAAIENSSACKDGQHGNCGKVE